MTVSKTFASLSGKNLGNFAQTAFRPKEWRRLTAAIAVCVRPGRPVDWLRD